ncbi:MAG: lycopene cyclase domain-containing protein [Chloroflexota bacterium]
MTYFGFLALFLGIPLAVFGAIHWYLNQQNVPLPPSFRTWSSVNVVLGLVVVAVVWTTPWDNYLVANAVWWYDPNLVTGYVIGYVPIEEYTFFVLQTILTGMITVFLIRMWPSYFVPAQFRSNTRVQWISSAIVVIAWSVSTVFLVSGYLPSTYMTLIMSWALIPILIQFIFGADILWHYRRILFWGIVPITLFLAWADHIAIGSGTWTISKEMTLGIYVGPILPLEEFTFFLVTNVLVVFGVTLLLAKQSHVRAADIPYLKNWVAPPPAVLESN